MRRVTVLAAAALLAGGCQHHRAPATPQVPRVVPGPPSAYASIAISTPSQTAEVSRDLMAPLAPLLATRRLPAPGPPSEYGLDRPQARLLYRARDGRTTEVVIGAPNFDHHFLYARGLGSEAVFLVPADTLRPVLALVGIELPAPG
jgi:hypothetical protein